MTSGNKKQIIFIRKLHISMWKVTEKCSSALKGKVTLIIWKTIIS